MDILLEIREFFKHGHPLTNVISCKIETLKTKTLRVGLQIEIILKSFKMSLPAVDKNNSKYKQGNAPLGNEVICKLLEKKYFRA